MQCIWNGAWASVYLENSIHLKKLLSNKQNYENSVRKEIWENQNNSEESLRNKEKWRKMKIYEGGIRIVLLKGNYEVCKILH